MDYRAQELERRLEALQLEVARKQALLSKHQPLHEVFLADLQKLLEFAQDAKIHASSSSSETSYVALRELFVSASTELERSALKICVGFESTANDEEARRSLLRGMLAPLEIVVTSLSSTQHGGAVTVLQAACRSKAKEVCLSCIALIKALFQQKGGEVSSSALAGSVEFVCQEIRMLPVSNLAAVKRQVFELCKTTVQDTSREFLEMHEAGGEVDFFGDGDEEEEEEEVETEDIQRLQHASKCFDSLKQLLLAVCKHSLDTLSTTKDLELVSQQCQQINVVCTDFAMEMYPRQDLGLITVQATKLRNLVEDLVSALPQRHEQLVEDFTQKLNLVVV